ncbi:NnrU family protein [Marinomonas rhizomae]|uniref:Putative membrane protein n=1 Tax=Marinomonas rhizomae TaxID=491948 RepID=A0A366JEU6_9GAMM|nr:NnrU family protein [Marinomonas rhizomae]RBP85512.1 putative membrane protein [Marinomonas rhizomae]RNF75847.1 NnrU family protein [Marinomonas rhizomae]
MLILVLGLVIFFVLHSIRLVAPQWREKSMAVHGEIRWKMRFGMITLIAFGLIILGYTQVRLEPVWLWFPPVWTRHLAGLLVLVALFFVGSALVPHTTMKKKVGYPMLIAIKIWAFAHLISNGTLADVIIFGSFLVWSIVSFAVYRRRDRKAGVVRDQESGVQFDLAAFTFAMVSWFAIAFYLHQAIIGVSPLV